MNIKTPTLYLAVENRTRELDAKILLGGTLAARGVTIVLGQQWLMSANMFRMPGGVFFFKGMNRIQVVNMERARKAGHFVVANDEEAVGAADYDFIMRDVSSDVHKVCQLILCQGERQQRALGGMMPMLKDHMPIVGNPRLDLVRSDFGELYRADAETIRQRYGRFILINTNLGGINSAWGSTARYFRVLINIGWIDPKNRENMELYREHIAFDRLNLIEIRRLIAMLRRAFNDRDIIVRPHPAENLAAWENAYRDVPGVKIVHEGSHMPWILASDILVHTGCTTGLEAQVAGHPAISIRPGTSRWRDFYISNRVNIIAGDAGAAAHMVEDFLRRDPDMFRRANPGLMAVVAEYFEGITGRFAFQRTADALFDLFRDNPRLGRYVWKPAGNFVRQMEREDYLQRKMSLTHAELKDRITLFQGVVGGFDAIETEEVADSVFVMRRRAA
jgi:surface carbohydrate biosynthesis protein